jgi:hypothetical protein
MIAALIIANVLALAGACFPTPPSITNSHGRDLFAPVALQPEIRKQHNHVVVSW